MAKLRVFLIDASIYIFRYYFSMPDNWRSQDNYPTAAAFGYSHWLMRLLQDIQPQFIAACFDESLSSCFRNQIYPAYKHRRELPDEPLAFQLRACRQITELLGIPTYASKEFEADDLIGTLAAKSRQRNFACTVISRDKDLAQLVVGQNDRLWDPPDGSQMSRCDIQQKLGVQPEQVADYLALVGDAGDDIPGVPGIGKKTAATLLSQFNGWPELRQNLDYLEPLPLRGASTIASKLERYASQIDMARQLTTITTTAELGRSYTIKRGGVDPVQLSDYADFLGFGLRFQSLIKNMIEIK